MKQKLFTIISIGCIFFLILTGLAMLVYAGGNSQDHAAKGYHFFYNFFSDLGRTVAYNGQTNWASAGLFFVALSLAGICLVAFFLTFQGFFRRNLIQHILAWIGTVLGVVAGLCFAGVAFTPANLFHAAHIQFVMWAFRLLPLAAFFYIIVMFMDKTFPRGYTWVLVAYWVLLVGYYLLITNGPDTASAQGLVIQAAGQKIISYASIISILILSLGARSRLAKQPSE